ncbi:MAG: sugar diacid utilization regulator, partial [Chloroflexi bacterium]|nr:sugar diacid utilization regulator [Chloroflexota bacterium]
TLFVHRSTVKYRLQRVREITGFDLNDPNVRFNLQLSTRAWQTLQALAPVCVPAMTRCVVTGDAPRGPEQDVIAEGPGWEGSGCDCTRRHGASASPTPPVARKRRGGTSR